LFCVITNPVRSDARLFKTLPTASEWPNFDNRLRLLHGTRWFWHHAANEYWEIIADKLSAAGWSWGYCSAVIPLHIFLPLHARGTRTQAVNTSVLLTELIALLTSPGLVALVLG